MNMFKPVKAKSSEEYIEMLEGDRKKDIEALDQFIRKTTPSLKPNFSTNMLGYGSFHYKSKSGREGDWPVVSLASQKNYISLYICAVDGDKYLAERFVKKFPKASVGKSCIRFKKLSDVNLSVIADILKKAAEKPGFQST